VAAQPTWFDLKYQSIMKDMSIEACLSLLATDPKIIQDAKDLMNSISEIGLSKTQVIRKAVCEALQ
jgi:hypothetical protein